jgi:hypothetical protein
VFDEEIDGAPINKLFEDYRVRTEQEFQQQLEEAFRELDEEKAKAVEEGREMDAKFPARIATLKRTKEQHRRALEEVIQSDNEDELEEESDEVDFSEEDYD